jgi:hypothetical protein
MSPLSIFSGTGSRGLAAGALLAAGACKPPPVPTYPDEPPADAAPAGPSLFRDVTADSGVEAGYGNGEEAGYYTILESVGGGIGLLDHDGDDGLNIFVAGGTFKGQEIRRRPCRPLKNLGGLKFQDVTPEAGLDRPLFYTHSCAVPDHDRDGWLDLLVTGWVASWPDGTSATWSAPG